MKLKVDKFLVFNFIPVGEGKNLIDLDLTPEMREKMLNILYDYYVKYNQLKKENGSLC